MHGPVVKFCATVVSNDQVVSSDLVPEFFGTRGYEEIEIAMQVDAA